MSQKRGSPILKKYTYWWGAYFPQNRVLNNKKFSILANEKNHINCTPFHKACLESILCAKLLLKYRDNTKDINGNLP